MALRANKKGDESFVIGVAEIVESHVFDMESISFRSHDPVTVMVHGVVARISVRPPYNHRPIDISHVSMVRSLNVNSCVHVIGSHYVLENNVSNVFGKNRLF